jgi:Bacterial PH domain/Short C-terminal domain
MGAKERSIIYDLLKIDEYSRLARIWENNVLGVDELLVTGEIPRAALAGFFENNQRGLLIATDSRLIAFDKFAYWNVTHVFDTPFDVIKGIDHKIGWKSGEITIYYLTGGYKHVTLIDKNQIIEFVEWVRNRIGIEAHRQLESRGEQYSQAPIGSALKSPKPASIADELSKLVALRDSGALSETEFSEAKKKLLQ